MIFCGPTSGRERLERSELGCGLHRTRRCLGNGERTDESEDSRSLLWKQPFNHIHKCSGVCISNFKHIQLKDLTAGLVILFCIAMNTTHHVKSTNGYQHKQLCITMKRRIISTIQNEHMCPQPNKIKQGKPTRLAQFTLAT